MKKKPKPVAKQRKSVRIKGGPKEDIPTALRQSIKRQKKLLNLYVDDTPLEKETRPNSRKGRPNKMTAKQRDAILSSGDITPLDYLLTKMRSPAPTQFENESVTMFSVRYRLWSEQCLEAAKAAAPYCHSRLATIEHSGTDGGPINHHLTVEFVE